MKELEHIPMKEISKEEVMKDNTISWIIKYDMLKCDIIYEVNIDISQFDRYSEEILFMRKYNKENYPMKKFVFNLYTNKVFFTIITPKTQFIIGNIEEIDYNDEILEYSYGRREEN